jgi:cysteine desulfuration protein SufE
MGAHLGWFCPSRPDCAPPIFLGSRHVAASGIPAYIHLMDMLNDTRGTAKFDEILADFELLDEWEDRYRYVIELGRKLEPLPEEKRSSENKVQGCVSQVWLATKIARNGVPRLTFAGDSDAHIVRGLIAILFAIYSGRTAQEILETDANALLDRLHLSEHLTPQRSNGLMAMVKRIRHDAETALGKPTLH